VTDRSYDSANRESAARLSHLVATLTPAQLAVDLGAGWTVASALAHTGFWDRWQAERWTMMLAGKWSADDASLIEAEHLANEALHPYWAGVAAADVPALAVEAAARLDALAARAPDDLVAVLEGSPSAYMLHRHRHRGEHLDQIERGLAAAGLPVSAPEAAAAAGSASGTDTSFLALNASSNARLRALAEKLSAADLALAAGEDGWTAGQLIGHLAFWDRFLAARWRAALAAGPGVQPIWFDHEVADQLNDGLPPTWSAFATAAGAAAVADMIDAADAVDRLIASLPPETPFATILAERRSLLDRSIHRFEHIATLELALARRGS
jgi:hypothetical protein